MSRQSGNRFWEILIASNLVALQARSGDPVIALRGFKNMLNVWRRSADLMFASNGLGNLILLFDRLGNSTAAATLSGTMTKSFVSNSLVTESGGVQAARLSSKT